MKPEKKKKEAKNKYYPPEIKKYKISKLATQWNMDAIGAISPCGTC